VFEAVVAVSQSVDEEVVARGSPLDVVVLSSDERCHRIGP